MRAAINMAWEHGEKRKAKLPVQAINGRCLEVVTSSRGYWFEGKRQRN
jgi:hypothetical protein